MACLEVSRVIAERGNPHPLARAEPVQERVYHVGQVQPRRYNGMEALADAGQMLKNRARLADAGGSAGQQANALRRGQAVGLVVLDAGSLSETYWSGREAHRSP
jgi:hypothetical protein